MSIQASMQVSNPRPSTTVAARANANARSAVGPRRRGAQPSARYGVRDRQHSESTAPSLANRVVSERSVGWSSAPHPLVPMRDRRRSRAVRLRGRITLFAASILTLVGVVVAFGQLAGASDTPQSGAATEMVTVVAGDSLWSLATHAVSSGDPRDTVERIRELNGLEGSVIVPGDRLVVPVGVSGQ